MPNLRERVDLVRTAQPYDRGTEAVSALRRTIWAAIEPGKTDGFRLVCRWSDLSLITGTAGVDETHGSSDWHLEIEGKQFQNFDD